MRLINVETLKVQSFHDGDVPPYAILSHTLGQDEDEITLQQIQLTRADDDVLQTSSPRQIHLIKSKPGWRKLTGCAKLALTRGYKFM